MQETSEGEKNERAEQLTKGFTPVVVRTVCVTETHSLGYMWKDKRIPYWWLRNGELWTPALGSFFCAYNVQI